MKETCMQNYSSMKLELLALYWSITEKFRDILLGAEFTVFTDNSPLSYLQTTTKLSASEMRWRAELAEFNFKLQYRSGKQNANADAPSRKPVHGIEQGRLEVIEVEPSGDVSSESTTLPPTLRIRVEEVLSTLEGGYLMLMPNFWVSALQVRLQERPYWKASEWRSCLLYYSLFVLQGMLPARFLNQWFLLFFSCPHAPAEWGSSRGHR